MPTRLAAMTDERDQPDCSTEQHQTEEENEVTAADYLVAVARCRAGAARTLRASFLRARAAAHPPSRDRTGSRRRPCGSPGPGPGVPPPAPPRRPATARTHP